MRVKRCLAPSRVSSNAPAVGSPRITGVCATSPTLSASKCAATSRLEYVAPGDTVAELERIIRISDGAFKFLTVKLADAAEEVA